MVRGGDRDAAIVQEVSGRKLVRKLSRDQEDTLRKQGASPALLQELRNSSLLLDEKAARNFEAARASQPKPASRGGGEQRPAAARPRLHIFNASYGQPFNLGQWGGPDYEFVFLRFRQAGEDIIEPRLIDTISSQTDVATYLSPYTLDSLNYRTVRMPTRRFAPYLDESLTFPAPELGYTAVVTHAVGRTLAIDHQNPVRIEGVPYALYPVYGAGGVALYYIGGSGDSVKLAVRPML